MGKLQNRAQYVFVSFSLNLNLYSYLLVLHLFVLSSIYQPEQSDSSGLNNIIQVNTGAGMKTK